MNRLSTLAAAVLGLCVALPAASQTAAAAPPAKPAASAAQAKPAASAAQAKPAAAAAQAKGPSIVIPKAQAANKAAAPKTLGGKAANGKLLSRDELRSCLNRLDEVNAGSSELEQRRATLDREKEDLVKAGAPLKAERAELDIKLAQVRELQARTAAFSTEVEAFNAKVKALDEMGRSQREAAAEGINAERERLTKARAVLDADAGRLGPAYQTAAKSYNDRAQAHDTAIGDWNERNKVINEAALKKEEDRQAWLADCGNRPYQEADEAAIKAGK
jgi:hypothetical protein